MNNDDVGKFEFYVISFPDCLNINNKSFSDIVPISWITFNLDKTRCMVNYPDPPYQARVRGLIPSLTENKYRPMPTWKKWPAVIDDASSKYKQFDSDQRANNVVFEMCK